MPPLIKSLALCLCLTLPRAAFAQFPKFDGADAPKAVALGDVDAAASGTKADPRAVSSTGCVDKSKVLTHEAGCGVDLSFKYGKNTIKVKLIFDQAKEPSSGDGNLWAGGTPDRLTRWFSAANYVKSAADPNTDAWVIPARLYYDVKQPELPGMDTQAAGTSDWEFGIIQNSEKLVYKYGYGGKAQYGSPTSVEAQLLDMSKLMPTPPFYFTHARTDLGFGDNTVALKDTPSFEAPWYDPKKNEVQTASLKGKWTLWFVIRNKTNGDTIYLWNTAYDLSRDWAYDGTLMSAKGGVVTVTQGAGKGAAAPVVTPPTAAKELGAGWTKP